MDGIINVYKEKGYTSHDVVAKMRGILKQKKIGHTGTLDPDAQGVLPVCIGKATKLCDMLTVKDKEYKTVMLLGKTTDTQDISGQILNEREVDIEKKQLVDIIDSFHGEYDQIPPMYSALKVNGRKMYELAREGIVIDRPPRKVTIHNISISKIELPRVYMTVLCSKGTYIRTLCHDIGHKLGCGACMEQLIRTKSGIFELDTAMRLEQIEDCVKNDQIQEHIIPVDSMFENYPAIIVQEKYNKILYNGNILEIKCFENMTKENTSKSIRVYDKDHKFIAIYELDNKINCYRPAKMFI